METNTQRIRQPAYKVPINILTIGKYVKNDEEFAPNFIEIGDMKISRANIIGIIVNIDKNETETNSLIIDDGTGKMSIMGFENTPIRGDNSVGDIINVIGRIREFNNEKYIAPEIIKKTDERWMKVRKLEIEKSRINIEEEDPSTENTEIKEEEIESQETETNSTIDNHEKITQYIKNNDQGNGVEIEEITKSISINECEKLIENMLKEGDIFENLPGKVKVLE
ncbi:MAG: hypothetical protein KAK00_02750 [Nanoarchaeota archaeon]|nr:hypothetical protein [Nanoarchaeota archaeon]